jgi:Uma2 family endonuclease
LTVEPINAKGKATPTLTLELPSQKTQTALNLRRWRELLNDPALAGIEGRIETDRHGHILMAPPPAPRHGSYQSEIAYHLRHLLSYGRVLTECPISTADGVKAADAARASPERMRSLGNRACFPDAPEICVEVLSPANTTAEIDEKRALCFDAGAEEVWLCSTSGLMTFFTGKTARPLRASRICPEFPRRIALR